MKAELRDRERQLYRAEEARRQVQRQLAMIDRQIQRRMAALIPRLQAKSPRHDRDTPTEAFLECYRTSLAALTAARQPEIDALARKLARQDRALAELRQRRSALDHATPEEPSSVTASHAASRHSSHGVFRR